MENKLFDRIKSLALSLGAYRAEVIEVSKIETDGVFREMCRANYCGNYGKNWTCPPHVGEIDDLMASLKTYSHALVYQTVSELEDSYDFEGMMEAGKNHGALMMALRKAMEGEAISRSLHLGAGGCRVCERCAGRDGEPCRHPDLAAASLEAYGVNVSKLAEAAGMKYINGQDTVTYFGAVLFDPSAEVSVTVDGKQVAASCGALLSEVIRGEKPCGGHGRCGKCKVTAHGALSELSESEKRILSAEEIADGVRLACLTRVLGDCAVKTAKASDSARILTSADMPRDGALAPIFSSFGVAVDIGTTTLAARLFDKEGNARSESSRLNPQSRWGADVVSRIEASMAGEREAMAGAIRAELDEMIKELASGASIHTEEIDGVVITGNTVMLALLCADDTEPFSHAPFAVTELYGRVTDAEALKLASLPPDTAVYLPPCISAFVGADTVCAILSSGLCDRETAMLCDIGTNGEIALYHNGNLTVCSTAAGPAFEGVGISMGMRGEQGAIDKVALVNGRPSCHTIGEVAPRGICGSGLVDAVACLLDAEILDESGYLEDEIVNLEGDVSLTQKDVRMVQLAKSAICAGIKALAASQRIDLSRVEKTFIAGGFGNYLNRKSAARIGLLPVEMSEHSIAVGNSALAGAQMLLLNRNCFEETRQIVQKAKLLELSTDSVFVEEYMMGMVFEEV